MLKLKARADNQQLWELHEIYQDILGVYEKDGAHSELVQHYTATNTATLISALASSLFTGESTIDRSVIEACNNS